MNFYPCYDAPPTMAEELPQDFYSVVYYNHSFLPRFQLLYALEHIIGLTHFGLGMLGDKNGDGLLDFHEVEAHFTNLKTISKSDETLIAGTKLLLQQFKEISSGRFFISERELVDYTENLFIDLVISTLARSMADEVILSQLVFVLGAFFFASPKRLEIVPLINFELNNLDADYRIIGSSPFIIKVEALELV